MEHPPHHPSPATLLELKFPTIGADGKEPDAVRYGVAEWYPDMYEFGTNIRF
jgi:hypothetical protein